MAAISPSGDTQEAAGRPTGRLWRALASATLTLTLAGCFVTDNATRPGAAPKTVAEAPPPAPQAVRAPDGQARGPAHKPRTVEQLTPAVWAPPAVVGAPPEVADLIGAEAARLTALLGEPVLRRREAPAEVWQYVGSACVLHVFFYRADADAYRVVHIEASRQPSDADGCLGRLIREREAARES